MSGISASQLKSVLGSYFRTNNHIVKSMVYQPTELTPYMTEVAKVKGRFPALNNVLDHLVQGFTTTWNELGTSTFAVNELTNYHIKVNFPIVPDDIENSWLAELNGRNMKPADRPITQYIADTLKGKVNADRNYLHGQGVYDAAQLGTFGYAMNGLVKVLTDGAANNDQSMYKIPIATLTPANISDVVEDFESKIPQPFYDTMMPIFMSSVNARAYKAAYRAEWGRNLDYEKGALTESYLTGRPIVGLSCLNGSNLMFSTPKENFLHLTDLDNIPAVTDVQVLDYKVKIFMDWWEGIGFWINQMVFVSVPQGSGSGLTTGQSTYYSANA